MNLKYSLKPRVTIKTYLFVYLLILIAFSLYYVSPSALWLNLLIAWVLASLVEISLNATRKKIVHIPDAALITATIIVGVLPISTPTIIVSGAVITALVSKHFLHWKDRHIFNPANFAILTSVWLFGQQIEWWAASNFFVIVFVGLFIMWKLRRIWPSIIFLGGYFALILITETTVNFEAIKAAVTGDLSVYFFAFVMLPEPQTAAWKNKGRYLNSILAAVFAVILAQSNVKAPLIVALAAVNLLTPLVNNYTKAKYEN